MADPKLVQKALEKQTDLFDRAFQGDRSSQAYREGLKQLALAIMRMSDEELLHISNAANSFSNGRARAQQEISNKLMNAGVKVENAIDDKSMKEKGYTYKITLPPGMGEPLYAKSFNAAKEMAKEYGTGTKVEELK